MGLNIKYEQVNIFPSKHDHNVPCAVCYTSTKSTKLMIPAQTTCPKSWTTEYVGYLMTEYYDNKNECMYMNVLIGILNPFQAVAVILMVLCFIS